MRHSILAPQAWFIAALILSGTAVFAQTSQITGVVHDPSGAAVPNATVRLKRVDTGTVTPSTTNHDGVYAIPYLAPATYSVEASASSFAPTTTSAVLRTGQTLQLDLSLTVAGISQTVEVQDSALMEKESGAVDTEINQTFAAALPLNGRSFNSLLLLTAGTTADGAGYSVNGSRESQNQWYVDGVSGNFGAYNTSTLAGTATGGYAPLSATGGTDTLLSTDALEEFQVQTSSYAAEYGRTPGGQIQITSKSGTEQFHGTAYDYIRNNDLDANNWFNNRGGIARPVTRQNDFGGTFSGPILRHRTFFFFSYEGLRVDQPTTVNGFVPSTALRTSAPAALQPVLNAFPLPTGPAQTNGLAPYVASFPQTFTVNAIGFRLDHHFTDRLSFFGRYLHSPSLSTAPSSLSNLVTTSYGTHQGIAGLTWTATPSLSNDLRASYAVASSTANIQPLAMNGAVIPSFSTFYANQQPGNSYMYDNFQFGSGTVLLWGLSAGNEQRQINVVDSVTWVKGKHTLKFGVDYRHLTPSRDPAVSLYETTFSTLASVQSGTPTSQNVIGRVDNRLYFNQYGAYVEDTWRVARPLVLTYGLRWDLAPPPVFTEGPPLAAVTEVTNPGQMALAPSGAPLYVTDHHDFAPRLGFAYDIGGRPGFDTVLRGGAGLFWDMQESPIGNALGSTPPAQATAVYTGVSYPLPAVQQVPPAIALSPPFTSFYAFDPHLPTPRVLQYNVAVEQQLGRTQMLNVNYVGSSGYHLPRESALGSINSSFLLETLFNLNNADSSYNALQIKFQRQLSHGLQVMTQYTWAHSLDDGSSENGATQTVPVIGYSPKQDWGPSNFDVRHQFSFAATYTTNADRLGRVAGLLLSGWSIDPLLHIQSPLPVYVDYNVSISGVTVPLRPNLVPGVPLYLYGSQYPGGRAINSSAFTTLTTPSTTFATLQQGTAGRNIARGFSLIQPDVSLRRRFAIRERLGLEARMEAFNFVNHPNFGPPLGVLSGAGFGIATTTYNSAASGFTTPISLYQVGGPRSIQLSLKLMF